MNQKVKKLSSWSMMLSFLCAIHCMAMPVLIASVSLMGASFLMNPFWEAVILILSGILAFTALLTSFFRHKKIAPLLIFVGSLFLLIPGMMIHHHILIASGSMISATALFFNWRASKAAGCSHSHGL